MRIACFGDSWTEGWGCETNWPTELGKLLNAEVNNLGRSGASNYIINDLINTINFKDYDLIVIAWSGTSRIHVNGYFFELSCVSELINGESYQSINEKRIAYYKSKSLHDILGPLDEIIKNLNHKSELSKIPIKHFTVFGDLPLKNYDNFVKKSFLEYLANDQGNFFKYDIPIFEYDFLSKVNDDLIYDFARKNNFDKFWTRAIVEREEIRPGLNFLGCGHPNTRGHIKLAGFIHGHI